MVASSRALSLAAHRVRHADDPPGEGGYGAEAWDPAGAVMHEDARITPLGAANRIVDAYRAAGGVVEYVLVDALDAGDAQSVTAAAAMAEIERRWGRFVEGRIAQYPDLRRERFLRIQTDFSRATRRVISTTEFIGRGYDHARGRLETTWEQGKDGSLLGKAQAPGRPFLTDAYAEAFADPPYPIRADVEKCSTWFNAINRDLLGELSDELEIVSWSTHWSSWFQDGCEWWGAFFWTIRPVQRPWMVAIAASATD